MNWCFVATAGSYDSLKSRYDFDNISFTKLKSVYKQRTGDTQDDTQEKIIKMIKGNPQVSTADMAKELKIGIVTVKRRIKKMSNVSYVGSGYGGHWEINK